MKRRAAYDLITKRIYHLNSIKSKYMEKIKSGDIQDVDVILTAQIIEELNFLHVIKTYF